MADPILDTSVFIDLFRRKPAADLFVGTRLRSGRLVLHAAVAAELIAGVRNRAEMREFDALCDRARKLYPTEVDCVFGPATMPRPYTCERDGLGGLSCRGLGDAIGRAGRDDQRKTLQRHPRTSRRSAVLIASDLTT